MTTQLKTYLLSSLLLLAANVLSAKTELYFVEAHAGTIEPVSQDLSSAVDFRALDSRDPGVLFNVAYEDVINRNGIGFDDPVLGAKRRAVAEAVVHYLESVIKNRGGKCDILFRESYNTATTTLASAGTIYYVGSTSSTFQPGVAFERIVENIDDPSPTEPDIRVQVNFYHNYNLEWTESTRENRTDFFSLLLHEITHGLGIASLASSEGDGRSKFDTSPWNKPVFTTYDNLLYTADGNKLWNSKGQILNADLVASGDDKVVLKGNKTCELFVTPDGPPVYTPSVYRSGSSLSHWQNGSPIPSTAVMLPELKHDTDNRSLSSFELAALQDLGYQIEFPNAIVGWAMY